MSLAIFLLAASLFNLGLSIFFLLYNLYLLDRAFNESFLGIMMGMQTVGSICGTLPAGWFASRFGLGAALRIAFAGGATICALRAWSTGRAELLALAFLAGMALAFWAVSIPPVVAQLSTEKNRPRAFSLFFSLGIAMGVLGGLVGGKLPGWVGLPSGVESFRTKQTALWMGCGLSALALGPMLWLKFAPAAATERKSVVYPRTPFVRRYLAAATVWNLFVGAFPPFFNTYFARRFAAGTDKIGLVFSGSQLAQAAAILLAPVLFVRVGLRRGIPITQAAAAILLGLLAGPKGTPAVIPAGLLYAGYMSFQWMSEPGWQSLLMNRVRPEEQGGASSLNFFVFFSAQAVAATLFGLAVPRLGYSAALVSTAAVGLLSAWLFRRLLGDAAASTTSHTSSR